MRRFLEGCGLIAAGGAVLLAVGTVLRWGSIPPKAADPPLWDLLVLVVIASGVVLVLAGLMQIFAGVFKAGTKRVDDWRMRPQLELTPTPTGTWAVRPTSALADFVQIRVVNNATRPQGDAVKVFGHLHVHGPSGRLLDLPARCAASVSYPSDGTEERTEIGAGLSREFNVAVRFHGESDAFMVNSESFARYGARNPEWRLPPGTYEVEFRVSHERGSKAETYVLRNPTAGPLELITRRKKEDDRPPAAPEATRTSEQTSGPSPIGMAVQSPIASDPQRTVAEAARVIATVATAPQVRRGDRDQRAGLVTIVLGSDFRVLRLVIESVGVAFTRVTLPIVTFTKSMGRDARQLEYRARFTSQQEMSLEVLGSPEAGSLVTISELMLDIARNAELGPIRAHVDVVGESGKVGARRLGPLGVVVDESRWAMREQPILQAIDRLTTEHGGPTWTKVCEATGLAPDQVQIGLRRLFDAGYVTGIDVTTMGPTGFELINIALLEPGLKAVNAWPDSGQLRSQQDG